MIKEQATGFRILVHPDQIDRKTSSGIDMYTDETYEIAQRAVDIGTVLSIGEFAFQMQRFGNKCPIKVGDKIRFKKYATHLFRHQDNLRQPVGDWFGVINDDDVLTIVEEA